MPRSLAHLAMMLALVLACLVLSSTHNTAEAASSIAIRADEVDNYDLNRDFEGASGSFVKAGRMSVRQTDSKSMDEFSNYDNQATAEQAQEPAVQFGGIELSSEETQSFFLSLAMIVVSEIGDKTFLIAAIMAMKHPRLLVFSASLSALAIMSVLSAAFGHAVPNLIPKTYTNYLAALLFFCFGIRMFYDGYYMTEEEAKHELEEVTQELQDKEDLELLQRAEAGAANQDGDAKDDSTLVDLGPSSKGKKSGANGLVNLFQLLFSPIFVQTFVMTFLAEWGDRSQIATIALAAAHNMVWVSIGAVFGHSLCTGVAVIGGRMLATKISVRTVTLAGAVVFEIFAVVSLYESINGV
ncbi:hypothetical protein BG011_003739 [Mortierella polycephala]|uniref:GDT1 family protein n=1 Tax=Mortierella polycephala TaxID=41804 RepID=A0A9P6U2L0_9FUNG|nr:hypothetical protein BG011_003739 [Mortierella polycephala]